MVQTDETNSAGGPGPADPACGKHNPVAGSYVNWQCFAELDKVGLETIFGYESRANM